MKTSITLKKKPSHFNDLKKKVCSLIRKAIYLFVCFHCAQGYEVPYAINTLLHQFKATENFEMWKGQLKSKSIVPLERNKMRRNKAKRFNIIPKNNSRFLEAKFENIRRFSSDTHTYICMYIVFNEITF